MSSAGIRAGKAYVELGATDNKLRQVLARAQARLRSFARIANTAGAGLTAGGLASLTPLALMANSAAKSGAELFDMSRRTGASVEALSELKHASEQSGVSFESLTGGMTKLQKNIASGDEAFEQLGLSAEQLRDKTPDEQLAAVADKIAAIQNPALRTKAAMDVFGKSGADLLPMLLEGSQGISALREEARRLGLQVSSEDAAAADAFDDTWANVFLVIKDVSNEIGKALIPVLTQIGQYITPIIANIASWISQNRQLVVWVAGIAARVAALGAVLVGFGTTAAIVATAIGGLGVVVSAIGTVIAAIASPIGIAVAAFVALGTIIATQTEWGANMVNWFGQTFMSLFGTIQTTVGNIIGLLQAGQFGAAMELAWTAVDAAWQSGIAGLMNAWTTFKTWILNGWTTAVTSIAKAFNGAWGFVEIAWTETVGFFVDSWTSFTNFLTKTWNNTIGFVQKAWVRLKSLFDSDINVQAEVDRINQETGQKNTASDQSTQQILGDRFDKRFQRQVDIDQRSKDIDKELEDDRRRQIDERNAASDKLKAQRNAKAEAARARLDAANKDAAAVVDASKPPALKKPDIPSVNEFDQDQYLANIDKGMKQANVGTFSAAEAMRLGGPDDMQKKIADASEETAKNTQRLVKEFKEGISRLFTLGP